MKYILLVSVCLFTALGFVGLRENTLTEASVAPDATPTPSPSARGYGSAKQIPDEVKYLLLFQELQEIKAQDVENLARGDATAFKNSFYSVRLGLRNSQPASVEAIIEDCFAQIRPLDDRAHEIITQYRSQYPNGLLKKPQSPPEYKVGKGIEPLPPPPAELTQLQGQKNQHVLNARERIRTALGTTDFANFDAAVKENAARILEPMNYRPTKPRKVPTPNPGN